MNELQLLDVETVSGGFSGTSGFSGISVAISMSFGRTSPILMRLIRSSLISLACS